MESRKTVQMSLFAGQESQRLTQKQRRDVWTQGGSKQRVRGAGTGLTHMCPTLRRGEGRWEAALQHRKTWLGAP